MYSIWLHNSDEILHYIILFYSHFYSRFSNYINLVNFLSCLKVNLYIIRSTFGGFLGGGVGGGERPNYTSLFSMYMNNVCIYVFLVLLILIYFFRQILSADCDTCIVIEIVGLLNIKIIYICLYANEKPSTRDPISVYNCMTIMDNG